jgi:hypothetical protein
MRFAGRGGVVHTMNGVVLLLRFMVRWFLATIPHHSKPLFLFYRNNLLNHTGQTWSSLKMHTMNIFYFFSKHGTVMFSTEGCVEFVLILDMWLLI